MSNADALKYLKMEEQIKNRTLNEASLGRLDEHIRKVIREEMKTAKDELFREFEIYLAQRLRNVL